MPVLFLDIGSGTQDALLYSPNMELANCPKFVLPSPARQVSARIDALTLSGRDIHLHGLNMGGGFGGAVSRAVTVGRRVTAEPGAAKALADDPERVRSMGLDIVEHCPQGSVGVYLTDFDPGFWRAWLSAAGLSLPETVVVAAQDHGYHPGVSNRISRFKFWERFLREPQDGMVARPESLLMAVPPADLTRLAAIGSATAGPVADTGAAAMLGALFVPEIEAESRERGILAVNCGNGHTVAFLLFAGRVWGVYEHHTGLLTPERLREHLDRFARGKLSGEEIFADRGHGCLTMDLPPEAKGFTPMYVLGPQRDLLKGAPAAFPAPGGDMMLAGCYGLLKAWREMGEEEGPDGLGLDGPGRTTPSGSSDAPPRGCRSGGCGSRSNSACG